MNNHIYQQEYKKALIKEAEKRIEKEKKILQFITKDSDFFTSTVSQINYQLTKYDNFIETINELSYVGIVEDMKNGK